MSTRHIKGKTVGFHRPASRRNCPECGGKMVEVDRCCEKGMLFVWYECERNDCDGQWLQWLQPSPQNHGGHEH